MSNFNRQQNALNDEADELVASIKDKEAKDLIKKTFDQVDGALDDILNINYKQCELQDKWLPHKKEKQELEAKEDRLFALIDKTINMFNSLPEKQKKIVNANGIVKVIKKKVALTKDMLDDFWNEALKMEAIKEAADPFWRRKRK